MGSSGTNDATASPAAKPIAVAASHWTHNAKPTPIDIRDTAAFPHFGVGGPTRTNVASGRLSTNLTRCMCPSDEHQVPKYVLLPTGHAVGQCAHIGGASITVAAPQTSPHWLQLWSASITAASACPVGCPTHRGTQGGTVCS